MCMKLEGISGFNFWNVFGAGTQVCPQPLLRRAGHDEDSGVLTWYDAGKPSA